VICGHRRLPPRTRAAACAQCCGQKLSERCVRSCSLQQAGLLPADQNTDPAGADSDPEPQRCVRPSAQLVIGRVQALPAASGVGRQLRLEKDDGIGFRRWSPGSCRGVDRSLAVTGFKRVGLVGLRLFLRKSELAGSVCRVGNGGSGLSPVGSASWCVGAHRLRLPPGKDLTTQRRRSCPLKASGVAFRSEVPLRPGCCKEDGGSAPRLVEKLPFAPHCRLAASPLAKDGGLADSTRKTLSPFTVTRSSQWRFVITQASAAGASTSNQRSGQAAPVLIKKELPADQWAEPATGLVRRMTDGRGCNLTWRGNHSWISPASPQRLAH